MLDYVIRGWSIVGVGAGPLRSKVFFRLRRDVRDQALIARLDFSRHHDRLLHPPLLLEPRFNLGQLDSKSANLYLKIVAP